MKMVFSTWRNRKFPRSDHNDPRSIQQNSKFTLTSFAEWDLTNWLELWDTVLSTGLGSESLRIVPIPRQVERILTDSLDCKRYLRISSKMFRQPLKVRLRRTAEASWMCLLLLIHHVQRLCWSNQDPLYYWLKTSQSI